MEALLDRSLDLREIAGRFVDAFGAVFSRRMVWITFPDLQQKLRGYAHEIAVA
jgi:hypothetical protein